jgi:hypothetical protein
MPNWTNNTITVSASVDNMKQFDKSLAAMDNLNWKYSYND